MSLTIIPALLIVGFLLVRYPFALAALALFLPMESPGTGAVLAGFGVLVPLIYAGYFLAVFRTLHTLWIKRNTSVVTRRIGSIALLAAGTSGWMAFSMYACDVGKFELVGRSLGAVPGVLFALAYYNHRSARILLCLAIAVHLVIGCGMIVFPAGPLVLLRQTTTAGVDLPDVWALETTGYKDNAQFESAARFAFYAGVGLIVGLSLLLYKRKPLVRVFGACLASLGLAATFFTVERGIWIGIFIAVLTLIAPLKRERIGKLIYGIIFSGLALGVLAVCMSSTNTLLITLREHFLSVADDRYRIPAALRSVDVLISMPLFGVGGEVLKLIEIAGGAPHQSFYFFAVAYGVPAGVCVGILTWRSVVTSFRKPRPMRKAGLNQLDELLGRSLGWVVLGAALTNGMCGGSLGWIVLGFACLPWAYSVPISRAFRIPAQMRRAVAARAGGTKESW